MVIFAALIACLLCGNFAVSKGIRPARIRRFDLVGKNGSYTLAGYPSRAKSVGISADYRHFGRHGDGGFPHRGNRNFTSLQPNAIAPERPQTAFGESMGSNELDTRCVGCGEVLKKLEDALWLIGTLRLTAR
jgi:hypothetical protein